MHWFLLSLVLGATAYAAEPVEVWLGEELAVSYTARVEGDWLVVEARHEPGWHTYAMDNVSRAREKTGKEKPDTELPTVITAHDGLTVRGAWRQSPPLDLSKPEIRWYTWGFEGRSYFAAKIAEAALPASVRIDGQACTEELCAMIDGLAVPVELASESSIDPNSLVVAAREE